MGKSVGYLTVMFGADLKGFEKAMKKAQRSIGKFGASMKRTGANLTRNETLPIIGLGAVAVKTFATFEQSMLKVKAVSGATATEFKQLQNSARELGASTMFTASQVADLQFELAKLGFDSDEINKAQASILALSQATTHDLAESGEIVAATLNSFNMEASESARVADVFALASSNAAIDMEKLAASMPKVGAIAGALNMDVEKLTAQMMTLADRGMEASTMGTSLRKIFIDLSAKGISLEDALNAINTAIDPVTKATELFGNRAAAAAVILAKNTKATSDYEAELRNAGGTALKMASIMDSGVSGSLRRLRSASEDVAIELGGMLIPLLNNMISIIKSGIAFWKGLDQETRNTAVALALVATAIGPLLTVLGTLVTAFAMLMSPIGLVIAALTTGIILAIKNWDSFKYILVDFINYFIDLYNESSAFKFIIESISAIFKGLWSTIKHFGKDVIIVFNQLGKHGADIFGGLGEMIKGVFTGSLKTIKDGFSRLTEAFDNTFNSDESKKNLESWVDETNKIYDNAVENFKKKEKIEFISVKDIDKAVNTASNLVDKVLSKIKTKLGLNGGGETSVNSPTVETPEEQMGIDGTDLGLNIESPIWMYEFGDGLDFVNEKIEKTKSLMEMLSDTFGINKVVLTEYGKQVGATLSQGAESMAEFAKSTKNSIREAIGAVISLGVAKAVTASLESVMATGQWWLIPVIAGLAGGLAKTAFNSLIPAFEHGGLVSGPTTALVGEGPGINAGNPEVIAPLNKLKNLISGNGNNQQIEVFGKISGNDIFLSNSKSANSRLRGV